MWEFPWECEGLFPYTLLHSREHVAYLPGFLLGLQPCNPKASVATIFKFESFQCEDVSLAFIDCHYTVKLFNNLNLLNVYL